MKIGILTYFNLANYGANLQAYSTYKFLKNKGHDVLFIDWSPEEYYKSKIENAMKDKNKLHHFAFIEEMLPISKRCLNEFDICQVIKDERIDGIIIGSDAILQHHPILERTSFPSKHIITIGKPFVTTSFPSPFWGNFIDYLQQSIPIAVMSGSSQDSKYYFIIGREKKEMKESIEQFSYFSVRDTWTQRMIRYLTNGKVIPPVTPDPVFALKANAPESIPSKETIRMKYNLPENYVLFSFWNNSIVSCEWLKEIGGLFEKDGIVPVAFPMPGGVKFKHPFNITINTPSPLEWYSIIANASAYIGEKMHPIVTCLANSVPCFNFDHCGVKLFKGKIRYSKSSKIYHIMNEFGFGDNRINGSGLFYKSPKPEFVYEKIKNFNKTKCSQKANQYLVKYNEMMNTILETFKKKINE